MSGRAKRDLCREICLTLKLQMETDSHQLLMEPTERLGDDSLGHWLKLEKQHFDDCAGNCWIRKGAPWREEGDRPHGGLGRVRQCGASSGECKRQKGGHPISRWVKTKKGDEVRCRFVAHEIASRNPCNDLFAGTPPLYSARLQVSLAAVTHLETFKLMSMDVCCGFLCADCDLRVELPGQDRETGRYLVGKVEESTLLDQRCSPEME